MLQKAMLVYTRVHADVRTKNQQSVRQKEEKLCVVHTTTIGPVPSVSRVHGAGGAPGRNAFLPAFLPLHSCLGAV